MMAAAAAEAPQYTDSPIPPELEQSRPTYLYLVQKSVGARILHHVGNNTGDHEATGTVLSLVSEFVEPAPERTKQKSFDPRASINMMRYDLKRVGHVRPETRAQVRDEQLSHLAEGMGRAARTSFILKRQGGELVSFREGQWRPYMDMLVTGLRVAKQEAKDDPRRDFLATWADNNMKQGDDMNSLRPGQRRSWYSSYPHKEAALYGKQFIASCGLDFDRQLGFLYQATCLEDGSVLLETQTVDRSDRAGFENAMAAAEQHPEADLDELTRAYDEILMSRRGGTFSAGRRPERSEKDTWEFINQQQALIDYLLDELENIAASRLPEYAEEQATKKHIYGVWAHFKELLDGTVPPRQSGASALPLQYAEKGQPTIIGNLSPPDIAQQVHQSYLRFVQEGRVLVGCGGSISILKGEKDIMDASVDDIFSAIFGGEKNCPEVKNGQITNCPHCGKRVRAIVEKEKHTNSEIIYCSNDACEFAAPALRKVHQLRASQTRHIKAVYTYARASKADNGSAALKGNQ
jgi:hypothetical protein